MHFNFVSLNAQFVVLRTCYWKKKLEVGKNNGDRKIHSKISFKT
jgi:hypothetical protein